MFYERPKANHSQAINKTITVVATAIANLSRFPMTALWDEGGGMQ
jgi:hypothetical protein